MIKSKIKAWLRDFKKNTILNSINLLAIVGALILITLAGSWTYLALYPAAPTVNAKNFYMLSAKELSGKDEYAFVTTEDCEVIDKEVENGNTWFYSQRFIPITLNRNKKNATYKITATDLNFWNALNFDFIRGTSFTRNQFKNKENVVVVSDRFAKAYFGTVDVTGKYFHYGRLSFKVQGVFKATTVNQNLNFDLYIPNTLLPQGAGKDINPFFVAHNKQGFSELNTFLKKYNQTLSDEIGKEIYARSFRDVFFNSKDKRQKIAVLFIAIILPIISFANLFTRKMENRIPEMAIRRAVGATRRNVFLSLILENLVFIVFAGVITLIVAQPLLGLAFNRSGTGDIGTDFLSLRFYFFTLFLYLLFGIFSAVRPAWKVSAKSINSSINNFH